jgi:hypothetical protein
MYASRIDRNSTLSLDKNGTTLASDTSFEGAGHVGTLKRVDVNAAYPSRAPTYESQEDYLGSFNVSTKFDEYGKNVGSSAPLQDWAMQLPTNVSERAREATNRERATIKQRIALKLKPTTWPKT